MASLPASLFGMLLVLSVNYYFCCGTAGFEDVLSFATLYPMLPPFARWLRYSSPDRGLNFSFLPLEFGPSCYLLCLVGCEGVSWLISSPSLTGPHLLHFFKSCFHVKKLRLEDGDRRNRGQSLR